MESIVKQPVEDAVVEGEEHRHTQNLEPEDWSKKDDHLEQHDDTLHRQQPGMHM